VHHRRRQRALHLPFIPKDPRIVDSTGALELRFVPKKHAGHRRRHHRPGNGDGVFDAGRERSMSSRCSTA
jgi:hypothetical protein